jgi:cyclic-di-GMP-binding protein
MTMGNCIFGAKPFTRWPGQRQSNCRHLALPFADKCGGICQNSAMPSFDIVSQVNSMEIENAVNQAKKELANRFDFKGSKWEIILEKTEIKLTAANEFKVATLNEIVIGKLAKRGISMKSIEQCDPDISPLGHARQSIKIKNGIESVVAKEIASFIRDSKLKVTTQIQGDEVRVQGKSRDDLQAVIAAVRGHEFPVAVQFVNFRD